MNAETAKDQPLVVSECDKFVCVCVCLCMWIVRIQSVRLPLDCSARSLSPKENHRTQKNENLYNIVGLLCVLVDC